MYELLAVFKSRSQAMDCAARMRVANLRCALIATPKEAGVGCGLSIKIDRAQLARAQNIIKSGRYSAFYGFITPKSSWQNGVYRR